MATRSASGPQPRSASLQLASALRESFRNGYSTRDLRSDLIAGMIVGVIALPLSMALAIASGVAPQYGLYTAIVAGTATALFGGSRVQVSGPTAAFVVILAPITQQFGIAGLLLATLLAGVMLILMGICRVGRLIEFVPYPVTTGFTAGIAVVIATLQLKDFCGLSVTGHAENFIMRVYDLVGALPSANWPDLAIGLLTLTILVLWPRLTHRIPAPLVALPVAAGAALMLTAFVDGIHLDTISSRFTYEAGGALHFGIPRMPPAFGWPWELPGPGGGSLTLSLDVAKALLAAAFAIAMLGAIESLLSAVVADGITGEKHDPDAELFAQGIGNVIAPFFGGFASTGAIARTATNVRSGARSPLAAVFHALFILAAMVSLAPLLGYLPMASLAALLLIVAWNMSEVRHFVHMLRVAPGSDVAVLLTCFGLTVIFDMVVSVSVGVVLAALLFMRRMADVGGVRLVGGAHPQLSQPLPPGVVLYEIAGPLFFGAAQKAMSALRSIAQDVRIVVLDMRDVPVMDATGLVNLESTLLRLRRTQAFVIIAGAQRQPLRVMARAQWRKHGEWLTVTRSFERGVAFARELSARLEQHGKTRISSARITATPAQ